MKPYAITESSKTWSGYKSGEKVVGYKDRNGFFYWWKSKTTAIKYAKYYSEDDLIYFATIQDCDEARIYKTYIGRI